MRSFRHGSLLGWFNESFKRCWSDHLLHTPARAAARGDGRTPNNQQQEEEDHSNRRTPTTSSSTTYHLAGILQNAGAHRATEVEAERRVGPNIHSTARGYPHSRRVEEEKGGH
jgi:hypothetical protein